MSQTSQNHSAPVQPSDYEEVEDLWGEGTETSKPRTVNSAFSEPSVVMDVDLEEKAVQGDDGLEQQEATESFEGAPGNAKAAKASGKSKPNVAILAGAGVLGLAMLVGGGLFLKHKMSPSGVPIGEEVPLSSVSVPAQVSIPSPAVSVFEDPGKAAAAGPAILEPTAVAAVVPTSAPGAVAAAAPASAVSPQTGAPAKAAAALAPVVTAAAPADAKLTAPGAKTADTPVAKAAPKVAHAQPARDARPQREKRVADSVVVAQASSKKVRSHRRASVTRHAAAEPVETFLLPRDLKLQAIFPQVGPNVQAWVVDGLGRTEIVHVGDTLRSGSKVTAITGHKGEVVTTSGVITSRGVR